VFERAQELMSSLWAGTKYSQIRSDWTRLIHIKAARADAETDNEHFDGKMTE